MISKINRVQGLGLVFADFTWKAELQPLRALNLIYGWNGCGKTTLTRLFDEILAPTDTELSYELEMADGTKLGRGDEFPLPVRVFNQDYIQRNVRVLEASANSISLLLGETSKELVAQIESDERLLNGDPNDPNNVGLIKELSGYAQKKRRKESENDTAFTDIARTIGAALANMGSASRTYRSPQAKTDLSALTAPVTLSDTEMEEHVLALKQEMLTELVGLQLPVIDGPNQFAALLEDCAARATRLSATTVETEVIDRLAKNSEISEWVETGVHLHDGAEVCEFCGSNIPAGRLAQLARHFSETDRRLKAEIETVLVELRGALSSVRAYSAHDPARLYGELRPQYEEALSEFSMARDGLEAAITQVGKALQSKKARTTEMIEFNGSLDVNPLTGAIAKANAQISLHNAKSRDFGKVQASAAQAIKSHYLSTIYEAVQERRRIIADLEVDLPRREAEISAIRRRIGEARAQISSAHAACEQINEGLKTFLGRDELRFEPLVEGVEDETGSKEETVVGYAITRGMKPAKYLSEGEKTAIAFVYFVVHLADGQFRKTDGIVVIDDPISSLDSNSLYQAFSFLKNAVLDCGQVFVLTHNFDFLKLLLNWRKRSRPSTSFYMINNEIRGTDRHAQLQAMDRELLEHESEYHFLFKRLKQMRAEQDGSIMRAYPVPNIARKVWDSFLMVQVPSGANPYLKMNELKNAGHDPQKLDAIYKFTNDQSHITGAGFDPALVPETQKVLDELFSMMREIAPLHYDILDRSTPI